MVERRLFLNSPGRGERERERERERKRERERERENGPRIEKDNGEDKGEGKKGHRAHAGERERGR